MKTGFVCCSRSRSVYTPVFCFEREKEMTTDTKMQKENKTSVPPKALMTPTARGLGAGKMLP